VQEHLVQQLLMVHAHEEAQVGEGNIPNREKTTCYILFGDVALQAQNAILDLNAIVPPE
jgi:hypothetical protein